RFTYLPHMGLFVLLVWSVFELPVQRVKIALPLLCAAIVALAAVSSRQVRYWQDSEMLFDHILAVTPDNDITEYYMGLALLQEKHDPTRARQYFERTLQLNPKYSGAYMRLGDIFYAEQRFNEAEQHYRAAVNAEPNATICNLKLAQLLAKKQGGAE